MGWWLCPFALPVRAYTDFHEKDIKRLLLILPVNWAYDDLKKKIRIVYSFFLNRKSKLSETH